jgi:hypothetical protein
MPTLIETVTMMRDYYGTPGQTLEAFAKAYVNPNATTVSDSLYMTSQKHLADAIGDNYLTGIVELVDASHELASQAETTIDGHNTEMAEFDKLAKSNQERIALDREYNGQIVSARDRLVQFTDRFGTWSETQASQVNNQLQHEFAVDAYRDKLEAVVENGDKQNAQLKAQWEAISGKALPKIEEIDLTASLGEKQTAKENLNLLNASVKAITDQVSQQHDSLEVYGKNIENQLTNAKNGGQDNVDYLNFLARPIAVETDQVSANHDLQNWQEGMPTQGKHELRLKKQGKLNIRAIVLSILSAAFLLVMFVKRMVVHHEENQSL